VKAKKNLPEVLVPLLKTTRRQIFQIPIKISLLLSDYLEKVQAGNFSFPDFSVECPICGGKNCAVRIGYYYRWAIDIDLQNNKIQILRIPSARYLCRGIKKPKHKHKTFSLLPDMLIPYNHISIHLMMYILQLLITEKYPGHTLEEIDSITPDDTFFSEKMLNHLFEIIRQARIKLILFYQQFKNTERAPPDLHAYTMDETITYILRYPAPANEHPLKGAYHLSVLYYTTQGEYHKNARFLFGTASQFCR
jgi:hypothetical protein